ncbi:phosphatidate cytidylyltransferase [Salana multivorans]|uniref:phosphatidate cytidylyltransferase n=1 Tax=Salana multivorans TaxID=120377 RepID=UPI000A68793C
MTTPDAPATEPEHSPPVSRRALRRAAATSATARGPEPAVDQPAVEETAGDEGTRPGSASTSVRTSTAPGTPAPDATVEPAAPQGPDRLSDTATVILSRRELRALRAETGAIPVVVEPTAAEPGAADRSRRPAEGADDRTHVAAGAPAGPVSTVSVTAAPVATAPASATQASATPTSAKPTGTVPAEPASAPTRPAPTNAGASATAGSASSSGDPIAAAAGSTADAEPASGTEPTIVAEPAVEPASAADEPPPAAVPTLAAPLDPITTMPVVAAPSSRAGRNLPVAIGVGLGLGALFLASLFIRKELFGVLAITVMVMAVMELRTALAKVRVAIPLLPLVVGTAGMVVSSYLVGPEALVVALVVTAGALVVWCVIDTPGALALRNASASVFVAAYVPFLGSFLGIALAAGDGALRVLYITALAVACDTGGYAAGVLWGRHPIAPTVSPKKSWEGFGGSIALAVAVGVGLGIWFFDLAWWAGLLLGVVAVLAAVVGDLAESLIKRDLGIKDMGSFLPGHGGMLDRIDALLVVAPVVTVLLAYLVPA